MQDKKGAVEIKGKNAEIFITRGYNDFFDRDDIGLIIELVGGINIFDEHHDRL